MLQENRNVFDRRATSLIPVTDSEPVTLPLHLWPTEILENLTPGRNTTDFVLIREVHLNFSQEQLEVFLDGVRGEIYRLRISSSEVSSLLESYVFIEYSHVQHPIKMNLSKDTTYAIRMYDIYNNIHDEFTFVSPVDIVLPVVQHKKDKEGKAVPDGSQTSTTLTETGGNESLPKTSDIGILNFVVLGLTMVLIIMFTVNRYKRKQGECSNG